MPATSPKEFPLSLPQPLNFIHSITHAVNQTNDPELILDKILEASIESSNADSGSIMLVDKQSGDLQIRSAHGLLAQSIGVRLKKGEGVTGWVAQEGKARLIFNSKEEANYLSLRPDLLSELAVPMLVQEEVIGVLSVDAQRAQAFDKKDLELLSILANLAANIFQNLKDNQILKIRDRFHRVLIDISRVISQSLHLKDIFAQIMAITEHAFQLQRSTLLLYNAQKDALCIEAALGMDTQEFKEIQYAPGEGISGEVFLNKKPVFIPSIFNSKAFLNRTQWDIKSCSDWGFFCCPIFSDLEVVGVFSTFTRPQSGIDPEFLLEFLEILGSALSQTITIQKLVQDENRIVHLENIQLKQELSKRYQFGTLIYRSSLMQQIIEKARLVAETRASVIISGESGTGKEIIASALHHNSPRREKRMVKLNCAAIPENLLESELFGYRKGAFTGANSDKKGKFEIAHGGTIFLDEIGELALNLQSKLLRVLQEREIEPIGGQARSVDIRIIAATNVDLEEQVRKKLFREDLYYRLNVVHLRIPSLRERQEDILPIVKHFIEKYSKDNEKAIKGITPAAIHFLENYHWPGNVRELENSIERAIVLATNDVLDCIDFLELQSKQKNAKQKNEGINSAELHSNNTFSTSKNSPTLPTTIKQGLKDKIKESKNTASRIKEIDKDSELASIIQQNQGNVWKSVIHQAEREVIQLCLRNNIWNKSKTARILGINRNTLDKKIHELEIVP